MTQPWLERFVDACTISESNAFRVVGALDPALDRRVTVVVAREGVDRARAARALDRFHAAHRDPPHATIARAVARVTHQDGDYVVLDFPARLDLDALVVVAAEADWRVSFEAADGFSATIRDAMLLSGERHDEDGRPRCLGTLGLGNVLFGSDGGHALIGYGHNVVCYDEHSRLVPRGRFFQAVEVLAGADPTSSSDLVALIRMSRTTLTFISIPEAIARCLRGSRLPEDAELSALLLRFEMSVVQSDPITRAPVPEILAMSQRIRALLGTRGDADAFRASVARLIAARRPDLLGTPRTIRVAHDHAWLECATERVPTTPLLRRLLKVLVAARFERPGQTLAPDELIAAGWPDEQMLHASARNRLYVALNALRKTGIGADLESEGGGYRLAPSLRIELSA